MRIVTTGLRTRSDDAVGAGLLAQSLALRCWRMAAREQSAQTIWRTVRRTEAVRGETLALHTWRVQQVKPCRGTPVWQLNRGRRVAECNRQEIYAG